MGHRGQGNALETCFPVATAAGDSMSREKAGSASQGMEDIGIDVSPDGDGVAEFVVAAPDRAAARAAFVVHGLRSMHGAPNLSG